MPCQPSVYMSLPIELWLKIAGGDEYLFNALVRAIPLLGRWTIGVRVGASENTHKANTTSLIINRRLDLMEMFGYSVEITTCRDATSLANKGIVYNDTSEDKDYIVWYKNRVPHRNDVPAIVHMNDNHFSYEGCAYRYVWMKGGKVHRSPSSGGGPTSERVDGLVEWFVNGKFHREDGPSDMWSEYSIIWDIEGKRHRDDGPAEIFVDGEIEWCRHGQRYRDSGPDVINPWSSHYTGDL